MGQHQHDIDELKSFERLCLDLAASATMPEERAGLEIMAGNYRAEFLDINPATRLQTRCRHEAFSDLSEFGASC